MEHFELKSDECVLYKGNISIHNQKGSTQLILTNLNIVFISKYKKLFSPEEVSVETFPINDIKVYENTPQILTKSLTAEIYFTNGEKEIIFPTKTELHKFVNVATKLISGKTTAQRNAEKIKGAISLVDDTLGIDSVHVAGSALKNGTPGKAINLLGKGIALISKLGKKK